tara:strand:+ start:1428 stop:1670 length:243 start_codon:yes stop_codon:yes gene_type:complete
MEKFVEDQINHYAQSIIDGSDKKDSYALGELNFYMALRRVLKGKSDIQDLGLMDAVNDVMQELGVVPDGTTFLKMIKEKD